MPPGHAFALELPPPCPRIRSVAHQPPDKGSCQNSRCKTMGLWGKSKGIAHPTRMMSSVSLQLPSATTCFSASWECARQFRASSETQPTPTPSEPFEPSALAHGSALALPPPVGDQRWGTIPKASVKIGQEPKEPNEPAINLYPEPLESRVA